MLIEAAMIFALGALVACLLWLLALPVLSRRTRRLAAARLARQMPMTMAEFDAERDQLRAAHAVAIRRLEQAGETAGTRIAALMAETGRYATRTVALEARGARLQEERNQVERERDAALRAMREAEGTLGTQAILLHDALGIAERRGESLRDAQARLATALAAGDEQRASIEALEVRMSEQDERLRAAQAQAVGIPEELAAARAALEEALGQRDVARADAYLVTAQRKALQASVDALTAELASLQGELEEAGRAAARTADRAETQAKTIDGLTDRAVAKDNELAALHRLLTDARALVSEHSRAMAEREDDATLPGAAGSGAEARLRAAVAALGADLVAFSTRGEGNAPGAGPD